MNFTDKQLSAFIDGELPEDEAKALEQALTSDPTLREALARLQNVDTVLSEALGGVADEAVPAHIAALIKPKSKPSETGNIVSLAGWRQYVSRFTMPAGLAASLLIGMIFGSQFLGSLDEGGQAGLMTGQVDDRSNLYAVLETAPSGTAEQGITPIVSFASQSGVCREVSTPSQRALACREDSTWTVLVVAEERASGSEESYRTASGDTSVIFDVLADQLMTSAPMSSSVEALRIEAGWADPTADPED